MTKYTKPDVHMSTLNLDELEGAEDTIVRNLKESKDGEVLEKGDFIEIHYLGLFKDGDDFDNSYDRGDSLKFPLGEGRVISGMDTALIGRKVGEQVALLIPSDKAYGERGAGAAIPPHTDLVFIVDIVGKSQKG